MKISYQLIYHPKVKTDDIPRLDNEIAKRIKTAIEQKLIANPLKYGFFLHGSLQGYKKLRVGDWRIVFRIVGNTIRIIAIGHRKDNIVYNKASSRL